MKKKILLVIIVLSVIIVFKFFSSDYEIEYNIGKHTIVETYKSGRYYFNIDNKYNFDLYGNRRIKKKLINNIELFKEENFKCIYPCIEDEVTYPLCMMNNENVSFDLIDSVLLNKFKNSKGKVIVASNDEYELYENDDKAYIAIWNYDGYYLINNKISKKIEMFETDTYENKLAFLLDKYLLMPDYDQKHIFNDFIVLNMENGKYEKIETKFEIDYDSYICGSKDYSLYLFDNKYKNLYEINLKKGNVSLIGSEFLGYKVIENGKFVSKSKNKYIKDKITYFEEKTNNFLIEDKHYYYVENENMKTKFIDSDFDLIKTYNNNVYYTIYDVVYLFNPYIGSEAILRYYELNFNKTNSIFIYNK